MTWTPILLADPSPCLRWLVLRDLFERPPQDEERAEIALQRESDPLVTEVIRLQAEDGSWASNVLATGRAGGSRTLMTALALCRLGYLGFGADYPPVAHGAAYLFAQQNPDGSWPLSEQVALTDGSRELHPDERYNMIPLQTAFPLRGLASCGYGTDPRAEKAYQWLLSQRLEDGACTLNIAPTAPPEKPSTTFWAARPEMPIPWAMRLHGWLALKDRADTSPISHASILPSFSIYVGV